MAKERGIVVRDYSTQAGWYIREVLREVSLYPQGFRAKAGILENLLLLDVQELEIAAEQLHRIWSQMSSAKKEEYKKTPLKEKEESKTPQKEKIKLKRKVKSAH